MASPSSSKENLLFSDSEDEEVILNPPKLMRKPSVAPARPLPPATAAHSLPSTPSTPPKALSEFKMPTPVNRKVSSLAFLFNHKTYYVGVKTATANAEDIMQVITEELLRVGAIYKGADTFGRATFTDTPRGDDKSRFVLLFSTFLDNPQLSAKDPHDLLVRVNSASKSLADFAFRAWGNSSGDPILCIFVDKDLLRKESSSIKKLEEHRTSVSQALKTLLEVEKKKKAGSNDFKESLQELNQLHQQLKQEEAENALTSIERRLNAYNSLGVIAALLAGFAISLVMEVDESAIDPEWQFIPQTAKCIGSLVAGLNFFALVTISMQYYYAYRILGLNPPNPDLAQEFLAETISFRHAAVDGVFASIPLFVLAAGLYVLMFKSTLGWSNLIAVMFMFAALVVILVGMRKHMQSFAHLHHRYGGEAIN